MPRTYEGGFGAGTVDDPLYADVSVHLADMERSAFSILAAVLNALRRAGASPDALLEYRTEAMAGTYEELLQTSMRWVQFRVQVT